MLLARNIQIHGLINYILPNLSVAIQQPSSVLATTQYSAHTIPEVSNNRVVYELRSHLKWMYQY